MFDQFGLGIQAFGSGAAFVEGYDVRGNIVFNNGVHFGRGPNVDNILFGIGVPMARIRLEENYTYHTPDANKGYSRVGWASDQRPQKDVLVRGELLDWRASPPWSCGTGDRRPLPATSLTRRHR